MEDVSRKHASERSGSEETRDSEDLRIVLLGLCGAGKRATANIILGREAFKESGSRESEMQRGEVENRNVSIIDTPGLFSTQLTDEELGEQMKKSLRLSRPGPHAFLLVVHPETFREERRSAVERIQKIFGARVVKFTMALFITTETDINESGNIKELLESFERRFHTINGKNKRDPYQIAALLKSIDEMVKSNGGQNYSEEIFLKNEAIEEEKRLIQEMARKSLDSKVDFRIVLLGKTASGKSSAGNTIFGDVVFKSGMSSNSITRRCQMHLSANISVVDTPGLFDTSTSPEQLKAEVMKCVYMSAPGPHVFLLVMRLDVRYTAEEKNTVKWIRENFGEEATRYTIILFTRGDQLEETDVEAYISENNDLKALGNECGDRFHSFNNRDSKNRSQVAELLKKIEKMVLENGGRHYTNEMYRKAQEVIEREARNQRTKGYTKTALTLIGGGVVGAAGAAMVAAAGGPGAVAGAVAGAAARGAGAGAGAAGRAAVGAGAAVMGLVKARFGL